ncbi:hypothetical protein G4B88_022815 [Cannabis sativa]|uniref:Prolamin-like domain-containing protein n=1 Tax=Cannabis sativa TaxID=3483 RepID=A0A7J6HWT0_CANSA|nr:hypothetical protein G4B88_022815 [Cannabis sativa]
MMKMKVVVVVFVYLILNPITSSSSMRMDPNYSPIASSSSSSSSSKFSVGRNIFKGLKCTNFVKEEMVDKILDHVNATKAVKITLMKSADFGICVANNFCDCLSLPYPPVMYGCMGVLGLKCMNDAVLKSPYLYSCALACVTSIITTATHTPKLDEKSIGDFCYSKCRKRV